MAPRGRRGRGRGREIAVHEPVIGENPVAAPSASTRAATESISLPPDDGTSPGSPTILTESISHLTLSEDEQLAEGRSSESAEPEIIVIKGEEYYRKDALAQKGKGKRKASQIWEEDKGFEIVNVKTGKKHYYCRICLDQLKDPSYKPLVVDGNSSVHTHFLRIHKINKEGMPIREESISTRTSSPALPELVTRFVFDKFKIALIRWVVFCHIAFSQIENRYFQALIFTLSAALVGFLPTRNTMRKWVMEEYEAQKKILKDELRKTRSKVHISFDLWTSPNYYALIAVVGHYIDCDGRRRVRLLGIKNIEGEHSGDNIAGAVLEVIKDYGIGDRVGFFMLDNASSNDVAVDIILRTLYPTMSDAARKRRRLRCLAHITNLVAQAFLLGPKANDVVDEIRQAYSRCDFDKIASIWRKHGALGRLHNIVRYIRLTPQRRQAFRAVVVEEERESWKEFNDLEVNLSTVLSYIYIQH